MTAEEYIKHYISGQGGFLSVSPDIALYAIKIAKQEAREEMMKDAITTKVINGWEYGKDEDHARIPTIHIKGDISFSIGDKVKVVLIKEE